MIQMPQRSITRFFIPLVDVMMLLFSIFLLMPILETAGTASADLDYLSRRELLRIAQIQRSNLEEFPTLVAQKKQLANEVNQLRNEVSTLRHLARLKKEEAGLVQKINDLRQKKMETLKNLLLVRNLIIDHKTGELIWYDTIDPKKRHIIKTQKDAWKLIQNDKKLADDKNREVFYLFVNEPGYEPFPLPQFRRDQYERWFQSVAHGKNAGNS